ncbi:hypothetical protein E3P99_00148 [Wallemia hederae]|uniref:protein-tyrosine-phosphatase n=1 Tax=Wallemia hederae TaxID=1540922 RepID=A0A4T0FYA7_9BASI|nr:hypothetical protein E3P99_00148 [Wallemia hederae]
MDNIAMDSVDNSLYIAPLSVDNGVLESVGIHRVVVALNGPLPVLFSDNRYQVLHLDIQDDDNQDILQHLIPTLDWIQDGIQRSSPTLILCQAGVSRSATIATAYLMRKYSLSLEEALSRLRESRPVADPNPNFKHQLKVFQLAGYSTSPSNPLVRRYRLLQRAKDISGHTNDNDDKQGLLHLYQQKQQRRISTTTAVRCKKCRIKLAGYDDIVMYIPTSPFYVEALDWMNLIGSEVAGKLYCPNEKCKNKVGTYDWTGVKDSSLDEYVVPAIMLHQNKSEVYQIGSAAISLRRRQSAQVMSQVEDKSQLDLEPNPFDQSFGASDDKDGKLPSISSLTRQQQQANEGMQEPGQQSGHTTHQPTNAAQHQLPPTAASAVPTSLRSGPLSPAMLQGPTQPQNPFETSFAQSNGIKTGLTPLPGGQYQPQSPNAAFFGMGIGQPPPALTPNTVSAINGVVASFDGNGRPLNQEQQQDAFQNYRNAGKSQGLEPPQANQQRYERNSGDAAANAANGLFLLSQASRHDQNSGDSPEAETGQKRKAESVSAPSPAASNKRKSTGGKGRGRKSNAAKKDDDEDEDDDAFEFDDDSAMAPTSSRAGSARGGQASKAEMTEDEKRKNFLERNRQAALKCRQRKKAWLQQLQQKVEFLQTDNEALQQTVVALREEIGVLRNVLSQHSGCNVAQAQGGSSASGGAGANSQSASNQQSQSGNPAAANNIMSPLPMQSSSLQQQHAQAQAQAQAQRAIY